MKLLDLFCGRFGWSREFARRGWECVGIDLVEPPEVPAGCSFIQADILAIDDLQNMVMPIDCLHCQGSGNFYGPADEDGDYLPCDDCDHGKVLTRLGPFDFICASSPCEQFSVHGMKHFHPNPPYPTLGIQLFNHTRALCEASGVPYVMENVRAAQGFVGNAVHHCGPFYLWGSGVPTIMPQGIAKGTLSAAGTKAEFFKIRDKFGKGRASEMAVIAPELSLAVCDYAERILEVPA